MRSQILIFISILLFACEEENSKKWTEVKITAKNYLTDEPISDINCGVLTVDDGFLFNDKTVILDEKMLDDGVYEFGFKAKKNKTYWAEASLSDVTKYHLVQFSNYLSITNNQLNEFNFNLVPQAYMRLHYKNVSCIDQNDSIYVYRPNIDVPNYNGFSFTQMDKLGCLDNMTNYSYIPCGRYHFEWHVTKNSITSIYHDTISLNEGDSITYLIEY